MTPLPASQSSKEIAPKTTARTIEVQEFAWLGSGDQLDTVFHYRMVYREGGHVIRDVLSTSRILEQIILALDGEAIVLEKSIIGRFSHPEKARACAHAIEIHQSRQVQINGQTISVAI